MQSESWAFPLQSEWLVFCVTWHLGGTDTGNSGPRNTRVPRSNGLLWSVLFRRSIHPVAWQSTANSLSCVPLKCLRKPTDLLRLVGTSPEFEPSFFSTAGVCHLPSFYVTYCSIVVLFVVFVFLILLALALSTNVIKQNTRINRKSVCCCCTLRFDLTHIRNVGGV